jgi:signal transduction histidine kinase/CheY-like chemotaxis protein
MNYNIEFQMLSLCVILIFIYQFFSKKKLKNEQNQIYGILLICSAIVLILDAGSVITITHMEKIPVLNMICAKGYLCSMACWVCVMANYSFSVNAAEQQEGRRINFNHIARWAFILVATLVCIIILTTQLNFWREGRLLYSYGTGTVFLYCYAGFTIGFVFLYTLINRKNITRQKRLSLYIFSTIQGITAMIQFLNPSVLLVSSGGAMSVIFIYFSLENPDMALIDELNLQRKRADAANQAKADFLAHMSHKIRTPINAILGMDEMILRESTDTEITNYASQIQTAGASLLAIVNDILDFSKIESGKTEIIPVEYDTASLFYDLITLTKLRAEKKQLNFQVQISPEIPSRLFGDEIRIKQVITNFLSNGIKYTHKGTVTLTANVERNEDNSVSLVVKVRDTGIGIRQEDIPKLFTSFERLDKEQNRHIEGTGLGMAISKQLITAMNGEIQIESQYGEGSIFTAIIPQTIVDATPMGDLEQRLKNQEKSSQPYLPDYTAPDASILVVDDNAVNIAVVSGLLKKTKVAVTSAASGEQCISLVKQQHFDIIFMDHLMPSMDGIQTLEKMNGMPDNLCQTTPVIVLTANAISGAKERYLSAGFADYLSKPVEPIKLDALMLKYLPEHLIG